VSAGETVVGRGSVIVVWGAGVVSELLLVYDLLLLNTQTRDMFPNCQIVSGSNVQPCTPPFPQLAITLPASGPIFSNGLLVLPLAILIGLPALIAGPILARHWGAFARAALLIVSIPASACVVLSLVSLAIRYPVFAASETCFWNPPVPNEPVGDPSCTFGAMAPMMAVFGVAFFPLLASLFLTMPAWVMALTETSYRQRRGWFVAVLYASPIAAMLYGLLGAWSLPASALEAPADLSEAAPQGNR